MGDSRKYPCHTTGGILEFPGRRGVSWTGILKAWGVMQFGIPNAWGGGGGSALNSVNFQREDSENFSLEIADLLTFLISKSSMNRGKRSCR